MTNRFRLFRRPVVQAALIQIVLLLIFFYTPISRFRHAVYTDADYLQSFNLTFVPVQPPSPEHNPNLSDSTQEFNAWLLFDRDQLRAGQFPLWNPYNGNGIPQFASYQTAVLSVFSLPFYVLPFKWALLLVAFAELFILGFFTYLFLRLLGLRQIPALFGGIAFMFCGYSMVWQLTMIEGTLTFLPLSLCCLEWAFRRYEQGSGGTFYQRLRWPAIGLTGSLTIGWLGGHPETVYFCGILIGAYTVFRLVQIGCKGRFGQAVRRDLAGLLLTIGLASGLSLAISAVQLIPFVEYFQNSYHVAIVASERVKITEPIQLWPLTVYPDLIGNPSDPHSVGYFAPSNRLFDQRVFQPEIASMPAAAQSTFGGTATFNYNQSNSGYVGGLVILLALFGTLAAVRSPRRGLILFFASVAILVVIFISNVFGLKALFTWIPFVNSTFANRSDPILALSLCVCAAFGLDEALGLPIKPSRRLWWVGGTVGVGLLLIVGSSIGAIGLLQIEASTQISAIGVTADLIRAGATDLMAHLAGINTVLGIAVVMLGWFWLARRPQWRMACAAALIGLNFMGTGFILRDYIPTVDEQLVYPVSPTMGTFLNTVNGKLLLVIGSTFLNAEVNLAYHINITGNYDGLGITYYDRLLSALFDTQTFAFVSTRISEPGMKLFGIEAVAITDGSLYDQLSQSPDYKALMLNPNYAIFSYEKRVAPYHTVAQASVTHSDDQVFSAVQSPDFDPASAVILSAPAGNIPPPQPIANAPIVPVTGVSETTVDFQLAIPGGYPQEGYLVLDRAFYPGWKARVNGQDRPVYRANYAFSAIPLHKGDTTIDFYYAPNSVTIGALLSLCGLLTLIVIAAIALRRSIRHRTSAPRQPDQLAPPSPGWSTPPSLPTRPELLDDDRFIY